MPDKAKLIGKYIDTSHGILKARVVPEEIHVWAIIGYLQAIDWNEAKTANDYDLPLEAVQAAVAFYKKHSAAIDAYLEMNALA